ncbi:MAG TPA: hypothetical protein VJM31_10210 [Vicinamibacterales bacterium]|nr:hypothetical protein [Vicinamibacterales bacterium]
MAKKAKNTKNEPAVVELVVRRGALRRFDKLQQKAQGLPVKVSWDRRTAERRAGTSNTTSNRRGADRRQKPPFPWDVSDFVIVDPTRK